MIEYFINSGKDQPLYITSEEKNFAFLNISKNAITSLKSLVLRERGLNGLDHQTIHRMIGHFPNQYNVEPEKIHLREKNRGHEYIKFAVIRDPISRFLSTYKLFWVNNFPHAYFDAIKQQYHIDSLEKFISWVINYELQKPVELQDEHIRHQYTWLNNIKNIDYIVPIEFLDSFIKNKIGIVNFKKENVSKHQLIVSEEESQKIKDIYKMDYETFARIPDSILYKA